VVDHSETLDDEWAAALAHAGFASERAVLFVVDGERPDNDEYASHAAPGQWVQSSSELWGYEERELANRPASRDLHRIAIWKPCDETQREIALFGTLLRHELEHARQWETCGRVVSSLDLIIALVHAAKYAGSKIPGSAYNAKPNEQDANASARLYLLDRHPAVAESVFSHPIGEAIRSALTPGDPASLPERITEYLYELEYGPDGPLGAIGWIRSSRDVRAIAELWERVERHRREQ
jgi:hypothetical protein